MPTTITVKVYKTVDDGDPKEIGELRFVETGRSLDTESFAFTMNENEHPYVPTPIRARGKIDNYLKRQSVWALIAEAVNAALSKRATH